MSIKKLNPGSFNSWVSACIQEHRVFGVQARGDHFSFAPLEQAENLRLDYDVTILPPKKYFQPPKETLLKFTTEGSFESVLEAEPFVLFGIHPYDLVAISQMDKIFSEKYCDIHYLNRRQKATLVVSDVWNASPNVFAGFMGTATVNEGFDILVTQLEDIYLVDSRTDKGELLMKSIADAPEADGFSLRMRHYLWDHNKLLLQKHELKVAPSVIPTLLEKSYEHPVWERNAALCFSCGSCNLVCPTCYCFDVQDEVEWSLKEGRRFRQWDGCLLFNFAAVAGGSNFRRNRTDRYRHRYYRKGKYLKDKIGQIACVGCGRCISACPARIANPVELYNSLLEEK